MGEHRAEPSTGTAAEPAELPVGALVTQLSEQSSKLVRSEVQLALAELQQKARHAGVGAGMFGTAGVVALFGVATSITTLILVLALVLPAWSAALIVTVVLFAVAGIAALMGKKRVSQATPPTPQQTIGNVKRDIETVKEGFQRDNSR